MSKRCAPQRRRNAQFQRHPTFCHVPPLDQGNNGRHPVFPMRMCPHARERFRLTKRGSQRPAFFIRKSLLVVSRDNARPRASSLPFKRSD